MTSANTNIDWKNLGFDIIPTKSFIRYEYSQGSWDKGALLTNTVIELDVFATALHYGQSCFEGLKAFRMKDGKVIIMNIIFHNV